MNRSSKDGASDILREDLHRSVIPDLNRPALQPLFYIDLHILTYIDYLKRREREREREKKEREKIMSEQKREKVEKRDMK